MHSLPPALSITLLLGSVALGPVSLAAQSERQTPATSFGTISVAEAMTKLQTLTEQPAPAGLGQPALAAYQAHTKWLRGVLARLEDAANGVVAPRDVATGQSSGKRQHTPLSIKTEYDALKTAIEDESVKFTGLSNVLKTRHDLAMNAIRNMK